MSLPDLFGNVDAEIRLSVSETVFNKQRFDGIHIDGEFFSELQQY